jgi:hypothetical protein
MTGLSYHTRGLEGTAGAAGLRLQEGQRFTRQRPRITLERTVQLYRINGLPLLIQLRHHRRKILPTSHGVGVIGA